MTNARLLFDALFTTTVLTASLTRLAPTPPAVGLAAFIACAGVSRPVAKFRDTPLAKSSQPVARGLTYTVTATAYQAVPNQTDSEPFVTADNSVIKPRYGSKKRWMALSNDLLKRWGGHFDYGDRVRVRGISPKLDGVYTVHDTMSRRRHHCMDVLTHKSENVDIFATGVKIQKVSF